jgi:NRPS condensation-like uncharacterized protein
MAEIPDRFPATGADAAISITRAVTSHRIGLSMILPREHLDPDRLGHAMRLSFDAEPLVGCAFRTDERNAYWQRTPYLDDRVALDVLAVADLERQVAEFQAEEVPDDGPQAAALLLRAPEHDHLCIKVSHILADGQAAKQYAYLLSSIYSRLRNDPSFVPAPNLEPRPSGRDVWANLTSEQRRKSRKAKSWTRATWPVTPDWSLGRGLTYRWATLPPECFLALKAYGGNRGCTVNDMMLAVVLRACIEQLDPPAGVPLSLMYTADLRRYLPDSDSLPISNISISGSLDIKRVVGESFDDTLDRVHARMREWASMCHGAGPLANAERFAGLGYRMTERLLLLAFRAGSDDKTYPWFTNIGIVDDSRLTFDGLAPSSAVMFGPIAVGASIVPVISTYRDSLTISMGCHDSTEATACTEELLESIVREATAVCA